MENSRSIYFLLLTLFILLIIYGTSVLLMASNSAWLYDGHKETVEGILKLSVLLFIPVLGITVYKADKIAKEGKA